MAETHQQPGNLPPSYTAPPPGPAPTYPGAPQQQQFVIMPQQGYVIQNAPVAEQTSCCGGRADSFRMTAGVTTGITHLVIAIACIVLSSVVFVYSDAPHPGMGSAIAASVIFFIPAGILGILTKTKNNCVIIGYLVMTILSAIEAVCVAGVEGIAAAFSSTVERCPDGPDYFGPFEEFPHMEDESGSSAQSYPVLSRSMIQCREEIMMTPFVLHIVISVLCFIEFIVAIVAAAYCCGGLRCCCSKPVNQLRTMTTMSYGPLTNETQTAHGKFQGQTGGEAEALPQKA